MSAAGETVGRDLEIPLPPKRNVFLRIEELPDDQDPANPLGRLVLLAKPSAYVFQLAKQVDAHPSDSEAAVTALYDLAQALMPKLARADVERVSAETIYQILTVFQQPITALEALAKNGAAPSAKAEKGSSLPTPSPIRSRRSRKGTGSGSVT